MKIPKQTITYIEFVRYYGNLGIYLHLKHKPDLILGDVILLSFVDTGLDGNFQVLENVNEYNFEESEIKQKDDCYFLELKNETSSFVCTFKELTTSDKWEPC
jgi:hypothetical protein